LIERVFEPVAAVWRGIGVIPRSGLALRPAFSRFDARRMLDMPQVADVMPPGCSCGEVLKGLIDPDACPLFGGACTPEHPVGPCMVSSEGSCAAFHSYER
jgi:hydrogenase expression/formation protein HypD